MSFLQYLDDKRYFLIFLAGMLSFVALMMFVSAEGTYRPGDIAYTLCGCASLAAVYVFGGYIRRRSRSEVWVKLMDSEWDELPEALPKPQTCEQRLYTEMIKKLYRSKLEAIGKLQDEKKDFHDFIVSWIHEVKLPITASTLLFRNSTGKSVEELVHIFEDELNKIDHYVEQALYYARIDSFSKDYLIAEVSLNRIVRNSVRKHAKMFVARRVRFTMWEEEQWVHSDAKWLGYIVDQIMSNALKYLGDGGSIACSIEVDPKEKRLLIKDTGIGITPEDIDRIFEKGFTGANGRQFAKSTGLGLYLANRMAGKLGHRLSVQSEEGTYTILTVHFPKSNHLYEM
ncbi:sensor histidine kinase [Paenibacillus sp.]|uniref:sensor histidine kinase n=1 Tax=Paenibacillus sp. TaxID=58172 RepID=UPI0028121D33|nr:sensor histidine kinase [Paenibacillus sp.]